ncbi:MAG: CrcB family protein [Planctomycetota bacterium]
MSWPGDVIAVAAGGSVGSVLRYAIICAVTQPSVQGSLARVAVPIGGGNALATTLANLLGCLALGAIYQWTTSNETPGLSPQTLLVVRVGMLGSLTTFSTLIGETFVLASLGRYSSAGLVLGLNLTLGFAVFLAGMAATRAWMTA